MIHSTNVIHSLMVVILGVPTSSTIHPSPCGHYKKQNKLLAFFIMNVYQIRLNEL